MSNYFKDNYNKIKYPIGPDGLRNAQIGAISAINSHFTVHEKEPAIIVMPTGSGKTAVLYLTAYTQRATRVLIITPSKLVRNQITAGFSNLMVLKDANVVGSDITSPTVFEVTKAMSTESEWNSLSEYDVIVSTPNAIVPDGNTVTAPKGFFDLVLIDEAHHSPAKTWDLILRAFNTSKKVLFTATPFRRDQKEIKGKIIYNYPISKAFEDKIFGEVGFVAVSTTDADTDIAIAQKANEVFQQDKADGLEHFLMVRTNSKKHAKELVGVYQNNTGLKLKRIDSAMSNRSIQLAIKQLRDKEIDGVICVDMLGEGFDFPNLKIAAIHHPHKSLAITLQFIGRFARTNAEKIGDAKFIAVPNEIEFFKLELYQEGKVWKDIIRELSEGTIEEEVKIKETLSQFDSKDIELEDDYDLSLYSLRPYHHVKVYETGSTVDITQGLIIPGNIIEKHFISDDLSVAVIVTKELQKPKWLTTDDLMDAKYNLFVVFYDKDNSLLFINATKKTTETYNQIATQYIGDKPKKLSLSDVHKVLLDFTDTEVFNLGLRSKNSFNKAESYIIKSGSHVQNAIKTDEMVSYEGGHTFMRGKDANSDSYGTIGYSSSSKVWSNTNSKIIDFVKWCKLLATKVSSTKTVVTNTNLDKISRREIYTQIPDGIIFASWDSNYYKLNLQYQYTSDVISKSGSVIDLEIRIVEAETDATKITYEIFDHEFCEKMVFTLADFHARVNKGTTTFSISDSEGELVEAETMINEEYYISFFLKDFSSIILNEISRNTSTITAFNPTKFRTIDWADTDIDCEFSGNTAGKLHIHEKLQSSLVSKSPAVLIYDHGTGETADFVMFRETTDTIVVDLYHCKGAGGKAPGNRVGDVYEVCGQAIKSSFYTSINELKTKLNHRTTMSNPSQFIIGTMAEIDRLIGLNKIFTFNIVAVQPGISKSNIQSNISGVLVAAESYIDRGDNVRLYVIGSE